MKLGRHSSASSLCTAGVPLGSVLGPLLFTAYVSTNRTCHRVVQYRLPSVRRRHPAVRCRRHAGHIDFSESECSNAVQRWFLENDLLLNGSKSETITVQLKSADAATTTVSIAGASLPISKELESLGVILDDHLRFDSHVRAVVKACAYHTHALRHVRHLLTTELATTIACSIVATRLDYCIWSDYPDG